MKKLASLLVLAALLLGACGSGSRQTAATVNGTDITVGDVEALMVPPEEGTVSKEMFAQFLGFDIQWTIVSQSAEDEYGISFTDEELEAEADSIFQDAAQEGQTREEFLDANGVTEEFLLQVANQQLLDEKLRELLAPDVEAPTQEEIDDARDVAAADLAEVCLSHILVATEDEANDVLGRLDAGEEFADLAAELSLDTGSGADGGVIECSPPSRFVPEFADAAMAAEIGEVTEPVETQFGFHLILVSDRTEADPADLPSDEELTQQLTDQAVATAANDWFIEQVEAATVEVDEEFGTWQANPPQVTPPTE